jgi:tRNA 5-methylaminomethyl-2-thiouridine biosynthesis bifunctional protein
MGYDAIVPATPAYRDDGVLYSPQYGDVFHSCAGALSQARHVFLGGNGLLGEHARWAGRPDYCILEIGFGSGINFLATWQAWQECVGRPDHLHYVAIEKHPFSTADMARVLSRFPLLQRESQALQAKWPPPTPGFHRLHWCHSAPSLTLVFGDALDWLPQIKLRANALYLDGFAPHQNPEAWSPALARELYRLALPGATLATWCVSRTAIAPLREAGFDVAKKPGLAPKRHMLTGCKPSCAVDRPPLRPEQVAIIGAGIAGASIAERLTARGVAVTVLDTAPTWAQGASGNRAGVFRPLPSADDNPLSRLLRSAFLYGLRQMDAMTHQGAPLRGQACGALHLSRNETDDARLQHIAQTQGLPDVLAYVDASSASDLAAWRLPAGGLWFPHGGWISPPTLCASALIGVDVRYQSTVARLCADDTGFSLFNASGTLLLRADHVVLANGVALPMFAPALPIRIGRGMVSHLPASSCPSLRCVVSRLGYAAPAIEGVHCVGATLTRDDADLRPRHEDHEENLIQIEKTLPGWARGIDPAQLAGRVGLRPLSPDRLPLVGAIAPRLWVLGGLGSRGLVLSGLCAETLAAMMLSEPLPLPMDLIRAIAPERFSLRPNRP